MVKILIIIGTRPEAIKMAPVIKELERYPHIFECTVCATAQHRQMLDQVLELFEIEPDFDLDLMTASQSLSRLTAQVVQSIESVLDQVKPDLMLVQGDTSTVMAASLSAFYKSVPVGHVEAGLRSKNLSEPFPEELNRRIVGMVAGYHFAPTTTACVHLLKEGVASGNVCVCGNTVIDALLHVTRRSHQWKEKRLATLSPKIVVITAHRRESFGTGLRNVCDAIAELSRIYPEVSFVYPVHLNPNVRSLVYGKLTGLDNVVLTNPLEYVDFCFLMKKAHLILTDSGGVQEEAPALNVPVLVLRNVTERVEVIETGAARLVGTDRERIVRETHKLLSDKYEYSKMAKAENPYGDGRAAEKIVRFIANKLAVGPLSRPDKSTPEPVAVEMSML